MKVMNINHFGRIDHAMVERDNRERFSLLSRISGRTQSGKPKPQTLLSQPARGRDRIEFLYSPAECVRNRAELRHFGPLFRHEIPDLTTDYEGILMRCVSKNNAATTVLAGSDRRDEISSESVLLPRSNCGGRGRRAEPAASRGWWLLFAAIC